jgi:hypothetical protein
MDDLLKKLAQTRMNLIQDENSRVGSLDNRNQISLANREFNRVAPEGYVIPSNAPMSFPEKILSPMYQNAENSEMLENLKEYEQLKKFLKGDKGM